MCKVDIWDLSKVVEAQVEMASKSIILLDIIQGAILFGHIVCLNPTLKDLL